VTFAAPRSPEPHADEREVLLGFLDWKREQVVATAEGLTEEQLRWTPGGRLLPIIGIINHLAHMEWRWVEGRYLTAPFPPREEEFAVGAEVTGADVVAAYWERAQRTDAVVRAALSLDVECVGCEGDGPPAHVLLELARAVDLRWLVLHLIEETSQHAGHADATREMLDGRKMRA
jgi:hypothetical protein